MTGKASCKKGQILFVCEKNEYIYLYMLRNCQKPLILITAIAKIPSDMKRNFYFLYPFALV